MYIYICLHIYVGLYICIHIYVCIYMIVIRVEFGYAHWSQLGSQIHCPIGNQIWGPLGKEGVCPNFALTVGKFVCSNSGNFRAKANPPKPRSCPKRPFGQ